VKRPVAGALARARPDRGVCGGRGSAGVVPPQLHDTQADRGGVLWRSVKRRGLRRNMLLSAQCPGYWCWHTAPITGSGPHECAQAAAPALDKQGLALEPHMASGSSPLDSFCASRGSS